MVERHGVGQGFPLRIPRPTGRLPLPACDLPRLGLGRDVMLLGMGSRFEIWDRARLQAHEDSLLEAPLPPAIADLVL